MNRELLEKQFTKDQLKQRKGNFGNMIDYVDVQLILQRLNDSFDGQWNFDIISHQIQATEVIVLGKLSAEGVHKTQFGSNKITVSKAGEVVSIGDDLKAATSDSLKKCASMFGVALHIYGDSLPDQPEEKTPPPEDKHNYNGFEKYRSAYFAQDVIKELNELERHVWNLKYIGKESTKQFNELDWKKAVELTRLQSNPLKFTNSVTKEILEDGKKELPHFNDQLNGGSGEGSPATKSQVTFIQHLLEKTG